MFGTQFVYGNPATSLAIDGDLRIVGLADGSAVTSRAVVIATGVSYRQLTVPGLESLAGAGVFYGAATTEAQALTGKRAFVVGGGNSAGQAALHVSRYAQQVTILVRSASLAASMSQYLIEQIAAKANITIDPFTEVAEAKGEDHLESIVTVTKGQEPRERTADALFVMIGAKACTHWLPEALQRDDKGFVCTGRDVADLPGWKGARTPFLLETNLPGFFCAGDVRHESIKRVSSGVGEGSMAIAFVHQYLALETAQARA